MIRGIQRQSRVSREAETNNVFNEDESSVVGNATEDEDMWLTLDRLSAVKVYPTTSYYTRVMKQCDSELTNIEYAVFSLNNHGQDIVTLDPTLDSARFCDTLEAKPKHCESQDCIIRLQLIVPAQV